MPLINLINYFDNHVCLSFGRPPSSIREFVQKLTTMPAVVAQNVANKSCLVCVMSENYASWVILRPQSDHFHRGKAKVCIQFQNHMVRVSEGKSNCY